MKETLLLSGTEASLKKGVDFGSLLEWMFVYPDVI